jgi:hypothetical protein
LLVDNDMVMVPAPPGSILDPGIEFEALVIPEPLDVGNSIERLRPARVDVLRLRTAMDSPLIAFVKLAQPSRHPPMMLRDGCTLRDALRARNGDVWAVLEDLGAISAGSREAPLDAILRRLPRIEREQRLLPRRDHVYDSIDLVAWDWCWISPTCEPCDPPPQP